MQKVIRSPQRAEFRRPQRIEFRSPQRVVMALTCALLLEACGLPGKSTLEVAPQSALTGPRVIAVMGTRTDVVVALEDALAERGFTFTRYENRDRSSGPAGQVKMGENVESGTKYALEVTPDIFDRCVGGGFQLTSLSVSVIDRSDNTLMLRSTAKGRTEKCPPTSGTIFHDIAAAIDAAWQK
ncbi:MAG TPA: hypothetical protein VN613_08590 [Gemmatimonadaceae bacterium]|nr:hypothetical protein [Gemmatimonadaceae bacterium]